MSETLNSVSWHYNNEFDDETLEIRGRKLFFIAVLFSIVVLFTAMFVLARRICRHHGGLLHSPPQPPPSSQPQEQGGLDAADIKRLPIILHQSPPGRSRAAEETECCICLAAFVDGEKLKVLPGCEHSFHCECVDKWLANHSNCPLCRASLKLHSSFPAILIQSPPITTTLPL